jgi:hypothetical protein
MSVALTLSVDFFTKDYFFKTAVRIGLLPSSTRLTPVALLEGKYRPGASIHERPLSDCEVIGARPYQPNRFVMALGPR